MPFRMRQCKLHPVLTVEEHQEPHVSDTTATVTIFNAEDTIVQENPQQHSLTEPPSACTVNATSQFTTCLSKLTLSLFSGNPLLWQTFWDSCSAAVHCNNFLNRV